MNFLENIFDAVATILANKLRSGLTMLGIIIGVASVVVMVAIGQGAQASVTGRISALGSNLLIVTPGGTSQTNVRGTSGGGRATLTLDDVATVLAGVPEIAKVSPEYSGRKQIIYGSANTSATVTGVLPAYEEVRNFHVATGRFISQNDEDEIARVAVIGTTIASTLFSDADPIGADIRVENNIFTVVGVMETKGQQGFGNADNAIFVPLATAQKRVFGVSDQLSTLYLSVAKVEAMEQAKSAVTLALIDAHQITDPANADFTVLNQADAIATLNDVTQIFTLLLGGIAAISLIVGGIGVMNIMLVSVTERTREIGIRKAIGASRRDILAQFLTESTLLSLFGGALGVALSYVIVGIVVSKISLPASISFSSLVLAFSFSVVIGIFFGMFPAYKASRLRPIEALRFE